MKLKWLPACFGWFFDISIHFLGIILLKQPKPMMRNLFFWYCLNNSFWETYIEQPVIQGNRPRSPQKVALLQGNPIPKMAETFRLRIYNLGGGFKYFFMFTLIWGRFPIWRAYFSDGWFSHQPVINCPDRGFSTIPSTRLAEGSLEVLKALQGADFWSQKWDAVMMCKNGGEYDFKGKQLGFMEEVSGWVSQTLHFIWKKQVEWCLPLVFLVLNELNVSIELMKLSLLMGGGVTWKDFVPRRGMGTFLFQMWKLMTQRHCFVKMKW